MSTVDTPVVFQVVYPNTDIAAPSQMDLLALWQPISTEKSFSTGGEQPGLIFSANLPEDPLASALLLNIHAQSLRQTDVALTATGPLLIQDLQRASIDGVKQGSGGYGIGSVLDTPSAVYGRYDLVAQAINYNATSFSFDLQDELTEAIEIVGRFAGSIHRLVNQFALVETSQGGQLRARTRVDWLGDVHTWWAAGSMASTTSDHRRVLAQALATRQAWLRLLTLLTAGAAKVGLAMAAGPFNPLAVWTAWKYVQKIIEQYRALQPTPD